MIQERFGLKGFWRIGRGDKVVLELADHFIPGT
jgi:hypothetical protein